MSQEAAQKLLILLLDDEQSILNVTRSLLEARGHEVMVATRFVDMVTTLHANKNRFVVALVDMNLSFQESSDRLGVGVLEHIKLSASHYVLPYVFSGDSTMETALKVFERGLAAGIISKGVTPDVFIAQVENPLLIEWAKNATLDELTCLPKYETFKKNVLYSLKELKLREPQGTSTLVMLDGDGFKKINDEHDHEVGDLALQAIAKEIAGSIKGIDPLCRRSGDEFFVFLSSADETEAAIAAKRIQCAVASTKVAGKNGSLVYPAVSYGMMQVKHHEISECGKKTIALLLDGAETALHHEKKINGNGR